jgi:16S rRNA (adenine1518-N6/adenine1519-N6)-dimethyltransferase
LARQKLGQHFLSSGKALELIARAACGDHVGLAVEIGPGRGALTEHLLPRADRLVALELDPELVRHLRGRWGSDSRVEIVETNALHANLAGWGAGVLVGNLPYYVATAIISRFLRAPGELSQGVFLIQKEVAERITAHPGSRDYGYLSVECQFLATTEYLSTVPPGAFKPPPKVDSAVVRLIPRTQEEAFPVDGLLGFVSACFGQKRKTLRNNLGGFCSREVLSEMPDLSRRAEELSVAEFVELYERLGPVRHT